MNKYAEIAVRATELCRSGASPRDAWQKAASEVFPGKKASQDKVCPRSAFLGLAEEGLIRGIPKGNYVRSPDNKRYAMEALSLIRSNPALAENPDELWGVVTAGVKKQHNAQMHVVSALWKRGDIVE